MFAVVLKSCSLHLFFLSINYWTLCATQTTDSSLAGGSHLCYYLNLQKNDTFIPLAAIFGYPTKNRLLILDHLGMYYEVKGKEAIRLSGKGDGRLRIDLEKATSGTLQSRWPSLSSATADDHEAIIYKGVPYFCLWNNSDTDSKPSGHCYSLKSKKTIDFKDSLLKESTSGTFIRDFTKLEKCRFKSSVKESSDSDSEGNFIMTFRKKDSKKKKKKDDEDDDDDDLECPVKWRTKATGVGSKQFKAAIMEYSGTVLILNLLEGFAFHKDEVVLGGNATVYRFPLIRLFKCDPSLVPRNEPVSRQSFFILLIGGIFGGLLLLEIAYISGLFNLCFDDSLGTLPSSISRRRKKQNKKQPKKKKKPKHKNSPSLSISNASKDSIDRKSRSKSLEKTAADTEDTTRGAEGAHPNEALASEVTAPSLYLPNEPTNTYFGAYAGQYVGAPGNPQGVPGGYQLAPADYQSQAAAYQQPASGPNHAYSSAPPGYPYAPYQSQATPYPPNQQTPQTNAAYSQANFLQNSYQPNSKPQQQTPY